MAKTTPSRAKSKTPAPKKKPTQLDRIEKSIGLIESKLTTLNAWETLNEAMSNDKLASPTVAVEDIKPLKAGDWAVVTCFRYTSVPAGTVAQVIASPLHVNDPDVWIECNRKRWCYFHKDLRPATPDEIAAHEAKVKAEAQAAEDAKLVFGARVKVEHSEAEWLYLRAMQNDPTAHLLAHDDGTAVVFRQFFTLLP